MSTYEERARKVFAERAQRYTTSAVHKDPNVLARVVAAADPRPEAIALDVATGTGHTALALAPFVGSVVATDLTPQMLAQAVRLRTEQGLRTVRFAAADAHHLPFPAASFQIVTCRRAAHHFSDLTQALGEMRRVLAWGGRLIIDDRSVPDDDFVDSCMNELDRWHDHSHVRQYREGEWQSFLGAAGFRVDLVEPYVLHRPLRAFTEGIPPADAAQIDTIVARLDDRQRSLLNLVDVGGEMHINHWYILIAATRS